MADVLSHFGYQSGVATGQAIKAALAPLTSRVDATYRLLSSFSAPVAQQGGMVSRSAAATANTQFSANGMGMSRATGKALGAEAHIYQSIIDIWTTPIGSCVFWRDYGSRLPDLLDNPLTPGTLLAIYTEAADSVTKWEPRFAVQKVSTATSAPEGGFISLILQGQIQFGKPKNVTLAVDMFRGVSNG